LHTGHPRGAYRRTGPPEGRREDDLLHLATGLLAPTTGTIEVLGGPPAASPAQLGRAGFVAQDTPAYATLSVADHLRLGAHLNPGWDADLARGSRSVLDTTYLVVLLIRPR
jgi:ABC-2 type transport system ATP-binding protein